MADVDIDPFGEHGRTEEPTDENIPLIPVGGSTWEPTREQETSFGGGESQRTKLMKDYINDLYKKLSKNIGEIPKLFHYDYFKPKGGELYYIGNRKPLMNQGKLKSVGLLADLLGENRLHRLGFNIPVGKITAQQAVMLNKAAEELPSESDITKADDIELQEIVEKEIVKSGFWHRQRHFWDTFGAYAFYEINHHQTITLLCWTLIHLRNHSASLHFA